MLNCKCVSFCDVSFRIIFHVSINPKSVVFISFRMVENSVDVLVKYVLHRTLILVW